MQHAMRKSLILGNWKMFGSRVGVEQLSKALRGTVRGVAVDVGVCPPFPYLLEVGNALRGSEIIVGAQDVCGEEAVEGAYTGEVSAAMLADCGASLVLIGHSERRTLYGDSDVVVFNKVARALRVGLVPVVCIGESLQQRESGSTLAVIESQLSGLLRLLEEKHWRQVVLAYEPVWAIGTGRTASPEQAQEVHAYTRSLVCAVHPQVAAGMRILYGGSVKPKNAAELFMQEDIDGALVGGASLNPVDFAAIVAAAE